MPVLDVGRRAAAVGTDDGKAGPERLQEGEAELLLPARAGVDTAGAGDVGDPVGRGAQDLRDLGVRPMAQKDEAPPGTRQARADGLDLREQADRSSAVGLSRSPPTTTRLKPSSSSGSPAHASTSCEIPLTRLSRATVSSSGSPSRRSRSDPMAAASERIAGASGAGTGRWPRPCPRRSLRGWSKPSGRTASNEGPASSARSSRSTPGRGEHRQRVGLSQHPLDEPRPEDVVVLEIGGWERRGTDTGRLALVQDGVRIGREREDDRHAEPAEDPCRGEGADVGEAEVSDVERPVADDRARERGLDVRPVNPLLGRREVAVRAEPQALDPRASPDRLVGPGVDARERRILERAREGHDLGDAGMGVERVGQAQEQRREPAAVAGTRAAQLGVQAALQRYLGDPEPGHPSTRKDGRKRGARRTQPALERESRDHGREPTPRGEARQTSDRTWMVRALAERPRGVRPAAGIGAKECVEQQAAASVGAARHGVEDEQPGRRIGLAQRRRRSGAGARGRTRPA